MPEITDWSDLTFDYEPVTKTYRPAPDAEPETRHYDLRNDVPTSILVRMFGIGALETAYRQALSETDAEGQPRTPDYGAAAEAMERAEAEVLRALAGIFHYTYPQTSVREWEAELATVFTSPERLALVQRFFTRSRASQRPLSASSAPRTAPASQTTPTPHKRTKGHTAPTGQGATRGKTHANEGTEDEAR